MSLNDNLTMVSSLQRGRLARPRRTRESSTVAQLVTSLNIRAPSPLVPAGALSGGNQQKVALGKWLLVKSRVLLLDEPTRGVDVAAKAEIHKLLREIASEGVGLLVSSSENDELLALCNRIVVMFRGRVVAALASDQFTEATLARYAGGLS
jgi:ABC-type sugar transport system ATPase subunit